MLIHFDGWSINHDYWARPDGPYVHPVGWAAASKRRLIPPQDSQPRNPTSGLLPQGSEQATLRINVLKEIYTMLRDR